jgi:ABC-type antimicrobial peptide transport system, ATPase component
MANILLELKNLTKVYKEGSQENKVLNGVDLIIPQGSFNVFIGPSGSGKSTLLNLIAMLDTVTEGQILFEGQDIVKLSERKKAKLRLNKMGFIFQFDGLLPEFSVIENVNMPALIGGKNAKGRAFELLKNLGMDNLAFKMPPSLSGGEKQRVAIARALINEPLLLLADEPTGNLDTTRKEQIFKDFAELAQKGITVLMVTHDVKAADYADYCYTIEDGSLKFKNK